MAASGLDLHQAFRVAVIIPFFQRQSGLLLKAVRSALTQSSGRPLIIVVDDSSPIAAEVELSALDSSELAHVRVLKQANAGPGAARNRGLSLIPAEIDYIAFLDSDDAWQPDHLKRASEAFALGADFYFTDYTPVDVDDSKSCFERSNLCPGDPVHQIVGQGLYKFGGDLFDSVLRRSPIGTSTVCFRKSIAQHHRFPTEFSYGEDAAFWLLLTSGGAHVVFSTSSEVIYGRGVNIAAAAKWGDPSILRKLYGEYRFHLTIATAYSLDETQSAWSQAYRKQITKDFFGNLGHLVRRFIPVDWRCVVKFMLLRAPTGAHSR